MFEDLGEGQSLVRKIQAKFSWGLVVQITSTFVGLVISGVGLYFLFEGEASSSGQGVVYAEENTQYCRDQSDLGIIVVDVGGAVNEPGVFELKTGSRINDAIQLSGDFSSTADEYYINKVLNLSERLNDGDKIYIPTAEETIEAEQSQENFSIKTSSSAGVVSINTASSEELMELDGIGEKRAEDIINERPYGSIDEMVERGVITESIFEKIKEEISI